MTTKTNLTNIEAVLEEFNTIEALQKELKRIQSVKCRLKKQKGKSTYNDEMAAVLASEQVLKEARQLLEPKSKAVTQFTQEDVDQLDYDEVAKALKSIQSKKSLTKWLTDVEGDNDEYRAACVIEAMLSERKSMLKPTDEAHVRKSDVQTIIDTLEDSGDLSKEQVLELLKKLV